MAESLAKRAYDTAGAAVSGRAWTVRDRITKEYMAFGLINGAVFPSNVATLMAYAQHLVDRRLTFRTINNYLSALKVNLGRLGLIQGILSIGHLRLS